MYEPRVRNRHVAPEKMDIPSNDGYSFLTSKKKKRKREKEREREREREKSRNRRIRRQKTTKLKTHLR